MDSAKTIAFDFPRLYRLLLIENNDHSAQIIRSGMKGLSCYFENVLSAEDSFKHPDLKRFDIIIVDVALPGEMDGIECCARLRRMGVTGGILFLTNRGDEMTRVLSFSSGGDAFLAKPFTFEEFLAIISALTNKLEKKKKVKKKEKIQVGDMILDQNLYKIDIGDRNYYLPSKEYMILEIFLQNKGKMISREQLLESVWGEKNGELVSNSVDVHIGRLRKKIGKDKIKTIRGKGYCFTP